jgi:hypothetical protein
MRWIMYGDIRSRHTVDSLITGLRAAGQDVVEVPAVARSHAFDPDPEKMAESRLRLEAAMPADVLFNFRPEELAPEQLEDLRARGVTTVVWFADDPLLYKLCYRHTAEAYDLTLHTGREDVLAFYEEKHAKRGYSFPFWTDDAHYSYGYDPDAADIEVGFLGNCHRPRRAARYDLLASLPWRVKFFGRLGRLPRSDPRFRAGDDNWREDHAGIHGGLLGPQEISGALRRFRIAINMAQPFVGVKDRYSFPRLHDFGEFFFPSRLVLYAAVGIPTVSITLPGSGPPFPSVMTVTNRDELIERIGPLLDDREALLAASRGARRDFDSLLTAQSRVAMLLSLIEGPRDHDRATRAELWRGFGGVAPAPAEPKRVVSTRRP